MRRDDKDMRGRPRGRREDGVVAVEFAIVSTVLFLVLFGIIEFGILFSRYEIFVAAAREGARHAAVRETNAQILAAVNDHADPYEPSMTPTITVNGSAAGDPPCTATTIGQPVAVSWNQTFNISLPFFPDMNPVVAIRGVFRCE